MAGAVRAAMESDEVPNDPLLDAGVLRALNVKLDGKLVSNPWTHVEGGYSAGWVG